MSGEQRTEWTAGRHQPGDAKFSNGSGKCLMLRCDPGTTIISLMNAQLTHSIGLNDVCDSLHLHQRDLSTIRGAVPPQITYDMFRTLFWKVMA